MHMSKKRFREERGATLVEASICYVLLFMALFAVLEFGLAFKDWLTVSHASREGARAGATFGNDINADINVLRNVEATMAVNGFRAGDQVRIYQANNPSQPGTVFSYAPGFDCGTIPSVDPALPGCCDWSPCPEFGRLTYSASNPLFLWQPLDRDVTAPTTDRIGVEVRFTHQWITRFFASTSDFTTTTEFQLEPQLFEIGS